MDSKLILKNTWKTLKKRGGGGGVHQVVEDIESVDGVRKLKFSELLIKTDTDCCAIGDGEKL